MQNVPFIFGQQHSCFLLILFVVTIDRAHWHTLKTFYFKRLSLAVKKEEDVTHIN